MLNIFIQTTKNVELCGIIFIEAIDVESTAEAFWFVANQSRCATVYRIEGKAHFHYL